MIWLAIKLLIKLRKSQKLHHRISQKKKNEEEILRQRFISHEKIQKIIDDLRLI